jgi:hypothetical protein
LFLISLLGLGITLAIDKYTSSNSYINKRYPQFEITKQNIRKQNIQRNRMLIAEAKEKFNIVIDPGTGLDQTGKRWISKLSIERGEV